ncbi:Eukaryotic porin/Tom40 protein [Dioscorea alata]|uniref:Eukaryotic porin/Tom40 protein n=1 Tax=Dioscorea alata TaxID=55571 RepID=A0ACB7U0W3_DIOAL|nr:Eukaryotic porin/Tom40 protein [Dioscorea alata]
MGPGLFSDIGKKAKDLLTNDYINDQKITISSETATGVAVTSSALKKGGLYALHVGSCFKYKKSIIDVKVDTDSNISSTIAFTDLLPSTKAIATLTLPDYNSAKMEVQYFHDHGSLASVVGFKQNPIVDLSATVGAHGFAFGAEVGFDTAAGNWGTREILFEFCMYTIWMKNRRVLWVERSAGGSQQMRTLSLLEGHMHWMN